MAYVMNDDNNANKVRWDRLAEILDDIKHMNDLEFKMKNYFKVEDAPTEFILEGAGPYSWDKYVRLKAIPRCQSSVCIAGDTVLKWGPDDLYVCDSKGVLASDPSNVLAIHNIAAKLLGLTSTQANYMFLGEWSCKAVQASREEAIEYLTAAIAEKNIFMKLGNAYIEEDDDDSSSDEE